jgi:hypothetical protein
MELWLRIVRRRRQLRPRSRLNLPPTATFASFWRGSRNRNGYGSGYSGLSGPGKDRYPAAVIIHTIAGYREANEGYAAPKLGKSGFATLTYDGFAARGLRRHDRAEPDGA